MPEPVVLIDNADPAITVVTLNRPERRNALSGELMDALVATVQQTQADPARRVLIVRGAGPVFCAGLDLKEACDLSNAERMAEGVASVMRTFATSRLVTIAAVHGAALAGGAGLMSVCDLAVAAEGTKFGYPEVFRGLLAGLIQRFLVRQVGDRAARELLILGQPIDTARALSIGMINRVVAPEALMSEATTLARQVLLAGPRAVELTKRLFEEMSPRSVEEDLAVALRCHLVSRHSEEADEGLRAFVEKRPPRWQVQAAAEQQR